jgi:DNA helicase-2/ATP-dependent DNA helicase PcrA
MTHCLDGRYSSQTITEYIGGRRAQIDFIDMIRLTIKLWETHPELLEYYRNRYRYVLVDEFQVALSSILLLLSRKSLNSSVSVPPPTQDTNRQQFELVRKLTEHTGRLTVVGDDDQCIYRFQVRPA